MSGGFLTQALIYLAAAIICVPVAKRIGMGSVLGYLLAGIIIGPFVLGFIGDEGGDIMHFAEFGVVMMLFLIGLELEPAKFWKLRKMILGMGLMQMGGTAVIIAVAAIALGFSWQASLATALAMAMSSTAIVLQTMKEKGLMQTGAGQGSFAILLFQDIAVIPILAILPLLAVANTTGAGTGHKLIDDLPGWAQTMSVIGAVGAVILAGNFIVVPLLRLVTKTRLRELSTASALFIVVGIAVLMEIVGLSPALGTFLAGVVLANSEFRHELESDLEPFKGLLLGLFFMAVGASINFKLVMSQPMAILGMVSAIMVVKALVLAITGKLFRLKINQNFLLAFALSQVGEFAFVLLSFIGQLDILDAESISIMMAVTALTMTLTPILLVINEKFIQPNVGVEQEEERNPDEIDEHNKVIIAGFGHFGSTIGRFLRANGVEATILDNDADQVELLRKMGFKVYYGDATRVDLLKSAGAEDARILIIATNSPEINLQMADTARKHYPNLELMVRTRNRFDAYDLMDVGLKNIYRETLDTSVRLGVDVLKKLGYRSYSATRSGQNFLKHDEAALLKLKTTWRSTDYIADVRKQIAEQEELLQADSQHNPATGDHAWDSEWMRETVNK